MLFTEDWLRQYCNPELSTNTLHYRLPCPV